jgi:hypothetical protein
MHNGSLRWIADPGLGDARRYTLFPLEIIIPLRYPSSTFCEVRNPFSVDSFPNFLVDCSGILNLGVIAQALKNAHLWA